MSHETINHINTHDDEDNDDASNEDGVIAVAVVFDGDGDDDIFDDYDYDELRMFKHKTVTFSSTNLL